MIWIGSTDPVRKEDIRKVSRSELSVLNLKVLSIKFPFAKGDLGGFKNRCNKSPPAPLYKVGRTGPESIALISNLYLLFLN
jgi:hypothetical protein